MKGKRGLCMPGCVLRVHVMPACLHACVTPSTELHLGLKALVGLKRVSQRHRAEWFRWCVANGWKVRCTHPGCQLVGCPEVQAQRGTAPWIKG